MRPRSGLTDYLERNRRVWTKANAEYTDARALEAWRQEEIDWGMFSVPEASLGVLGDVAGKDVIELGCGTAYFGAWLAKRGAWVTGVDLTPAQLETARRCSDELGIPMELIEANAEEVPLPDASFDLALSEYGASIWCDPYRWIPEAARILRPCGELVFLGRSYLSLLTSPDEDLPATEQLQRDHFGMHRFDWPDADGAVEFALTHGDMIRLLRDSGFEVEDLVEVRAPEGAETPADPLATAEWARRWPIEEAWKARKTT